mmetsp:Transcript_6494/g.14101  ORF Transcript_6494/g.14101 Transcript_6494/m.14101 type:complete len:771 (+) Transcript_6494:129-2441(+)
MWLRWLRPRLIFSSVLCFGWTPYTLSSLSATLGLSPLVLNVITPGLSTSKTSIVLCFHSIDFKRDRRSHLHWFSSSSRSLSMSTQQDADGSSQTSAVAPRRSSRRKVASSPPPKRSVNAKIKDESTKQTERPSFHDIHGESEGMLEKWIQHSHHSYHLDTFLSPPQAYKIRVALVSWYRTNRRKLPWRGDEGPYDGSTAGYGSSSSSSSSAKKMRGSKGKRLTNNGRKRKMPLQTEADFTAGEDIRSFFATSSKKAKVKVEELPVDKESEVEEEKKEEELLNEESSSSSNNQYKTKKEVTAYGIWVSEIMLQQTRVEAVIPYYLKWMESFPTVQDLANATEEEVNSHWAGLGFYRRARLLHSGAKRVVNDYDGIVPNTVDELLKVEGIGRYTASAIASIVYGVEVPVVDGNVCRVLSRLTGIANHIKAGVLKDDLGWTLAERIVQTKYCIDDCTSKIDLDELGSPGEVNQALMELGATYCSPAGSGIEEGDPLRQFYASTKIGLEIGRAVCFGETSSKRQVENMIAKVGNSGCRLCDPDGISSVFYDVADRITTEIASSPILQKPERIAAKAGNAALPTPPPKKAKREEVLAVAVMRLKSKDSEDRWLMVKRPPEGLLAGQWEFPSVCVWSSADDKTKPNKPKNATTIEKAKKSKTSIDEVEVPEIDSIMRTSALDSYLTRIMTTEALSGRKQFGNAPIEHIFSHVRHTMWIEHGSITEKKHSMMSMRWKSEDGIECGFLTESDMKSVGITSGVRKVLAAVHKLREIGRK